MRLVPRLAAALFLLPVVAAPAQPRRSWELASYTWIRRVPAEPGAAANGQPLPVDAAALAQALGSVRVMAGILDEPLFTPAEAANLSGPLADALATAGPGEDLELLSTSNRGGRFLASATGVTARLFVRDGRLNLLVHDARLDFLVAVNTLNATPTFTFGTRAKAGAEVLKGVETRRADWAVLPLTAQAVATPVQPVATAQPEAPAQPAAPAKADPPPALKERLRLLKECREQNLITDAEYAARKAELLKEI